MVYSVNLNQQNNYITTARTGVNVVGAAGKSEYSSASVQPAFTSNPQSAPVLRTKLDSKDEIVKYMHVTANVNKESKKALEIMLKSGILLNAKSNDNSTVLDNLYNIATTPRAKGLTNIGILQDTIAALSNPFTITQKFGDMPKEYRKQAEEAQSNTIIKNKAQSAPADSARDIDVDNAATCVAASIEFNLAQKQPAEFARFAEGLSSSKGYVEKTIKLSNLADNALEAIWLLNAWEIPYEATDFNSAKLKFAPDKNAILRAQIQTTHRDTYLKNTIGKIAKSSNAAPIERSPVDVLMQSTFMQVGSQQSYDSLTDKRGSKFNQDEKGLIEMEKTFTESVVEDKNKISLTYQIIDENGKLTGYETAPETVKKQIVESLAMGDNVIIGYTQVDRNRKVINGHEITIIGTKTDKDGKTIFICNDTDDDVAAPVEYGEDFLLPAIHHAALPKEIAEKYINLSENWVEGIKNYKEARDSKIKQAA